MKYVLYVTMNNEDSVNGINKIYVGVHQTDDVYDSYIGCGVYKDRPSTFMYPKNAFQYAVKKYGVNSFTRQILNVFDNIDDLFTCWDSMLTSKFVEQSFTYNCKIQELSGKVYLFDDRWKEPIYQFDLNGNLKKVWDNELAACEFFGEGFARFDWAIDGKYEYQSSYWSRSKSVEITGNKSRQYCYIYNMDGKLLIECLSKEICSEYIGFDVSDNIKNLVPAKQYFVSNSLRDEFIIKPRRQLKSQLMYIYKNDGTFVGKGVGKEIMNIIWEHSFKKIWNAIYYNKGWYKNYFISFEPIDKLPERKVQTVDVFDLYGNLIETLPIDKVRDRYKLTLGELHKIIKGVKRMPKYIFKYTSK